MINPKGIVVQQGKYNATQQYANWIAKELELPVFSAGGLAGNKLTGREFAVVCSAVYMGRLLIRGWLKKNLHALQRRKIFLVVVCATPATEKDKLDGVIRNSVPPSLIDQIEIFFLPGRLVISDLTLMDSLLLKMGARLEKDPATRQAMLRDIDGVKRENIEPIINTVRNFLVQENARFTLEAV